MTAVEWLESKLDDTLSDTDYLTWKLVCEDLKQAKEMEKQQIMEANIAGVNQGLYGYKNAKEYYNKTFKDNKL